MKTISSLKGKIKLNCKFTLKIQKRDITDNPKHELNYNMQTKKVLGICDFTVTN